MTVSGDAWRHPANYAEAKARLIGRQRLNRARQLFAAQLCDELVWPRLLKYGFDSWGVCARIGRELGLSRSTICRMRQRILRALV